MTVTRKESTTRHNSLTVGDQRWWRQHGAAAQDQSPVMGPVQMELLSSIATAIGALLALATAAVNLITAIRSRTRRSTVRVQRTSDGAADGPAAKPNDVIRRCE
jgi:hypothetical protein